MFWHEGNKKHHTIFCLQLIKHFVVVNECWLCWADMLRWVQLCRVHLAVESGSCFVHCQFAYIVEHVFSLKSKPIHYQNDFEILLKFRLFIHELTQIYRTFCGLWCTQIYWMSVVYDLCIILSHISLSETWVFSLLIKAWLDRISSW